MAPRGGWTEPLTMIPASAVTIPIVDDRVVMIFSVGETSYGTSRPTLVHDPS
jgi:hypothetical protein